MAHTMVVSGDPNRRILAFDLSIHGHHAVYIQHLIRYWSESKSDGELLIVVSPKFLQAHADVVQFAAAFESSTVKFIAIEPEEEEALNSRQSSLSRTLRNLREWRLLQKYAGTLAATHCLVMYLDTCELPLVLGFSLPCPFSGIYFRPTFHYSKLLNYKPGRKERLRQWREKLFLARTLSHPKMRSLFCLDPFVVEHLSPAPPATAIPLPDPVEISMPDNTDLQRMRDGFDIDPERQVFLLFGSFEAERKGIYQVLASLRLLPNELAQEVCLLIVGNAGAEEQRRINEQINAVSNLRPVQVRTKFEFVADQAVVKQYFQLADVVLALYQRHVGMSAILLLAALAQKPILSTNYGLMGELVRRYQLGLAVDSTSPEEIAAGLTRFLSEPSHEFGDQNQMRAFAEQHSAQRFAEVIFQQLQTS